MYVLLQIEQNQKRLVDDATYLIYMETSSHHLPTSVTFVGLSLSEPLLRWPPLVPSPIRAFEKLRILGAPLLANWRRGLAVDESTELTVVADVAAEIDVEFEAVVATEADR